MKTLRERFLVIILLLLAAIFFQTIATASIEKESSNQGEQKIERFYQQKSSWFNGLYELTNKDPEVGKVLDYLTKNIIDARLEKNDVIPIQAITPDQSIPLIILSQEDIKAKDNDQDGIIQNLRDDPWIITVGHSTTLNKDFLFIIDDPRISNHIKGLLLFMTGYKLMRSQENPKLSAGAVARESYKQLQRILVAIGGENYMKEVLTEGVKKKKEKNLLPMVSRNKKVAKIFAAKNEIEKNIIYDLFLIHTTFNIIERDFPKTSEQKELEFIERNHLK